MLLLLGGVLLGPEVASVVEPASLGAGLNTVVGLAVALILFEGGLSLDIDGYHRAPTVIKRMLTLGPLVTWLGTAAAGMWLLDLDPGLALMMGSLVIVTGPTVISPLLRRLHIRKRVHHVLFWEGVLIDAVGVFIAVLCYEWLTIEDTYGGALPAGRFALRVLMGIGLGVAAGLTIDTLLRRAWIPAEYAGTFVLACALATFGISDVVLTESGILSTVVAGLVVGLRRPPHLDKVKNFGLQLTEVAIGVVFILLAAKLDLNQFRGWPLLGMLGIVVLVLRPTAVFLATWGQKFDLSEKLLLSWIAPRGIVAATMASLFATRLTAHGHAQAVYLETFTYAVIGATVTIQGLSAPWVVRVLGLQRSQAQRWALLGEPALVSALERGLRRAGVPVVHLSEDNHAPQSEDLGDIKAVLCADSKGRPNADTLLATGVWPRTRDWFEWHTGDTQSPTRPGAGQRVWAAALAASQAVHALEAGAAVIDVVDVGDPDERGRFGPNLLPLFWVRNGDAEIVKDPSNPGPPRGDLVVVLRRRVARIAELIQHIDIVHTQEPTLPQVIAQLVTSAARVHPGLPVDEITDDVVARWSSMPVATGSGIAIPHGYWDGIERSCCFLGLAVNGVDCDTPDGEPIRLVFLILSPVGKAKEHLDSLAAIGTLGQEPEFLRLLTRQRAPSRVAQLLAERA